MQVLGRNAKAIYCRGKSEVPQPGRHRATSFSFSAARVTWTALTSPTNDVWCHKVLLLGKFTSAWDGATSLADLSYCVPTPSEFMAPGPQHKLGC